MRSRPSPRKPLNYAHFSEVKFELDVVDHSSLTPIDPLIDSS